MSARYDSVRPRQEATISAGHISVDHYALVVHAALVFPGKRPHSRRAVRIDAQSVGDPANADIINGILDRAPCVHWNVDISEHAALVTDHIYQELALAFPVHRRRLRTGYFSEDTGRLHQAVARLRHYVCAQTSALRATLLRCAFLSWRADGPPFDEVYRGRWLWSLQLHRARGCMLLRRFGLLLRSGCRHDRSNHLAQLSAEVAQASPQEVSAAVKKVLKPKRFRKSGPDPLPALKKPDGSLCRTRDEITATWRDHFRVLEGGVVTDSTSLIRSCRQHQLKHEGEDCFDLTDVPTWLTLENAFRRTAARKAAGPDLVPPVLCRAFCGKLADVFWPILMKTVCRSAEAAGMKGGILYHIGKAGAPESRSCSSRRGILVQSCFSKVVHRAFRGAAVSHWQRHSLPNQIGGRAGCSATFGHLISRAVLYYAKCRGWSAGLIFLDLTSAYYAVIRETLVGGCLSERPLTELTDALGLDVADLQHLRHLIDNEPILATQDASQLLQDLSRELHSHTWFILSQDNALVQTERGTRPGGALADVLFSVLFGRAISKRHSGALSHATLRVPWQGFRTPFPMPGLADAPECAIEDVIYADDLCTPVLCKEAVSLRPLVSAVTADTLDTLAPHAFRANLGPTKTAALVSPRGVGSRKARAEMFVQLKGKISLWADSKGLRWLDLVPRYKHLGSIVVHSGSLLPEIRHRVSLGQAAFRAGRRKLFACKQIPLERRASLFRTHVLSTIMVGAGSWPELSGQEWAAFSGGLIGLYRQLLGLRAEGDWHLTEAQLVSRAGLPPPQACCRRSV